MLSHQNSNFRSLIKIKNYKSLSKMPSVLLESSPISTKLPWQLLWTTLLTSLKILAITSRLQSRSTDRPPRTIREKRRAAKRNKLQDLRINIHSLSP